MRSIMFRQTSKKNTLNCYSMHTDNIPLVSVNVFVIPTKSIGASASGVSFTGVAVARIIMNK